MSACDPLTKETSGQKEERRETEGVCDQRGAAHAVGLLAEWKFTGLASVSVTMRPRYLRAAGPRPPTLPARPRRTSAILARRKQAVHATDLSLQEQHPAFPGGAPGTALVSRGGPQLLPSAHFSASEQCMILFLSAVLSHARPQMGTLEAPRFPGEQAAEGHTRPTRPKTGCRRAVQMPFVPRPEASLLNPQDLLPARGCAAGASMWPNRARSLLSRGQTCGPMALSATVPSF